MKTYIENIINEIKLLDENFTNKKKYGKIVIEINYKQKYLCDCIKVEETKKREENN